ncbi:MAG: UDP-N-acetylmuramoylalanine--D-glutamate ligase [Syntrophorhabdaceae bacterium PtaU1.Bin034]|nr:MAG: UDP-N-acetylmuramoylalanine--D-glutamate ligase [Syntrophorhabdaceae bacterium PtaU1.Bin034]
MSEQFNTQHAARSLALPDRVLIVGLGTSGVSVVKFLAGMGKKVTVTDMKQEGELSASLKALNGVPFTGRFGFHDPHDFLDHDLIVISPGIVTGLPLLEEARRNGARVIGEIELAARFIEEPIIAITGTNGKTTTTTLMGLVFEKAFGRVFVGGNIGEPLINHVMSGRKADYVIAEISSFQLETIETFKPHTSILLNITEDHLDRYTAFADYIAAKMNIFSYQTASDQALLNSAITGTGRINAKKYYFSTAEIVDEGAFLDGDALKVRLNGTEFSYQRDLSPLVGIHNSENLLSVLLASHLYGIDRDVIEETIRNFNGLPHRVEFVRELKGIKFYNDSKATNVDATKRALESMKGNVILIAGGKDKGGSYGFITGLADRIKSMVLIGEARLRIEAELGPFMKTYSEGSLEDAVERAFRIAQKGDTVLFSPMCSSFDMFENYKTRGNVFKRAVEAL